MTAQRRLVAALPAIEKWYFRALTSVGLLFSVRPVCEFVRLNPSLRSRVKGFLDAVLFRGGGEGVWVSHSLPYRMRCAAFLRRGMPLNLIPTQM